MFTLLMFAIVFGFSSPIEIAQAQVPGGLPLPPQDPPGNIGADPVGAGDLIFISVVGSPELTRSFRVSGMGTLSLPFLPEPLRVNGLFASEIEKVVARELEHQRVLVEPTVSVMVLEYRSRPVNVTGAVKHPLTLQALDGLKLLDAIARAEGLAPEAGPEILISRPDSQEIQKIPVIQLFSGANPSLNIALRGGELIRVPEADKVYIVGNVKNPGTYPLKELEGLSVLKALALALPICEERSLCLPSDPWYKQPTGDPRPAQRNSSAEVAGRRATCERHFLCSGRLHEAAHDEHD
jgi:polysaccharide biosynthesis/export protein